MIMKKLLLAGGASLALSMGAAAAHAQSITTGFIGASYSDVSVSGGDLNVYDVSGTVAFDVADNFEVQIDGHAGSLDYSGPSSSDTIWGPTGHIFYDKDAVKIGAFVGYEDLGDSLGTGSNITGYGVEGRWAASDNITVGALAGWGTLSIDGAPDIDLTAYKVDASLFTSDHLRWDLSATHTAFDWGPFSGNAETWAFGGEYQMADKPISFTFGVSNASSGSQASDVRTLSLGVRHTIGGSLKDRDRTSSPFSGLPFDLGGPGGLSAGQTSLYKDLFDCLDDDLTCPSGAAIEAWQAKFSDTFNECDLFGTCNND